MPNNTVDALLKNVLILSGKKENNVKDLDKNNERKQAQTSALV